MRVACCGRSKKALSKVDTTSRAVYSAFLAVFSKTKRIFRTTRDLNIFSVTTFFIYKKVFSISLFIKTVLSITHDKSGEILHIKTSNGIVTKRLNLNNPEKQSGLNCIRSLTVLFVR